MHVHSQTSPIIEGDALNENAQNNHFRWLFWKNINAAVAE